MEGSHEGELDPSTLSAALAQLEAGGSVRLARPSLAHSSHHQPLTSLPSAWQQAARQMVHSVLNGDQKEQALLLLAECAASSPAVARNLLDSEVISCLLPLLNPSAHTKRICELTLRALCALSTQPGTTESMLKEGILPPLLSLTRTASESITVRIAVLLHNLADTPSNRLRLMHGRTLTVLTHVLIDPASGGSLKEHCLQAAASIAAFPTEELSFPQLLGKLCESKMPGQQREALACLGLIAEKAPQHCSRLGQVSEIAQGLAFAATSSDSACANEANALRARFDLA
ncbi:MAG: hypothetical protein SGPRY_001415 [Prymnesium sp.]